MTIGFGAMSIALHDAGLHSSTEQRLRTAEERAAWEQRQIGGISTSTRGLIADLHAVGGGR